MPLIALPPPTANLERPAPVPGGVELLAGRVGDADVKIWTTPRSASPSGSSPTTRSRTVGSVGASPRAVRPRASSVPSLPPHLLATGAATRARRPRDHHVRPPVGDHDSWGTLPRAGRASRLRYAMTPHAATRRRPRRTPQGRPLGEEASQHVEDAQTGGRVERPGGAPAEQGGEVARQGMRMLPARKLAAVWKPTVRKETATNGAPHLWMARSAR